VELTSDSEWDPNHKRYQESEEKLDLGLDYQVDHFPQADRVICELRAIQSSPLFPQFICSKLTTTVKVSATSSTTQRHSDSLRNKLSSIFGVRLDTATRTLNATPQLALKNAIHPIHKRFCTEVASISEAWWTIR
jgi:hypothetical protein